MRELNAIRRLLTSGNRSVRFSSTWESICSETGLGNRLGRELHFSPDEMIRLREYAVSAYGMDPQHDDPAVGRMAMADRDASEKLSSHSVFGHLLLLATVGTATITVSGQRVVSPTGSMITSEPEAVGRQQLREQNLIIIENGAVMTHAHQFQLPGAWRDSVCLYRGHGRNVRDVDSIIADQPSDRLGFFMDFDPAGVRLASLNGRGTLLVPDNWEALSHATPYNQPEVFHNQLSQLGDCLASTSMKVRTVAAHLKSEQLAIMQEHLVARKTQLAAIVLQ